MREVFFLIGDGDAVLWSDASESPVALPDSRARWEAIWSRRASIVEIAHSHPIGPLAFSAEDESTMEALVSALGRSVVFSVVAPTGMLRRDIPRDEHSAAPNVEESSARAPRTWRVSPEPWWAALLRLASGGAAAPRAT